MASFYDSIDHNVIKFFLTDIKVDNELIEFLLRCLKTWSCCTWTNQTNIIYHEHGIPQGPQPSGLLSEVVLKYIDDRGSKRGKIKYVRYVDDIKLFAKTENILRQRLITLDLAAKEVGLFPQSSKVNIRKVINPLDEIKSISRPPEPVDVISPNQEKLRKRILELITSILKGNVNTETFTRFKYLISKAAPHYKLNKRLITLLEHQPALSRHISIYFSQYWIAP